MKLQGFYKETGYRIVNLETSEEVYRAYRDDAPESLETILRYCRCTAEDIAAENNGIVSGFVKEE